MGVSTYGAQQWTGLLLGIGALPASFYVALCSDEPGEGWDGTVLQTLEPPANTTTTNYYPRPALGVGSSSWGVADAGFVTNTVAINWPQLPDVDWGQLGWYALTDSGTAGNLWCWEQFTDILTVTAGSTLSIPIGSFSVELANLLPSIAE
jgi:hypothetical protein